MANKSKKDKKLRRKENQEKEIKKERIEFDVLSLLRETQFETKPQVGDFLKQYVKSIRVLVSTQKITLYPVMQFSIGKVFVDFLDGHQIIAELSYSPEQYYLYYGVEEIMMKEREIGLVREFIEKLQTFGFVKERG